MKKSRNSYCQKKPSKTNKTKPLPQDTEITLLKLRERSTNFPTRTQCWLCWRCNQTTTPPLETISLLRILTTIDSVTSARGSSHPGRTTAPSATSVPWRWTITALGSATALVLGITNSSGSSSYTPCLAYCTRASLWKSMNLVSVQLVTSVCGA